jgi:hypothetical protein
MAAISSTSRALLRQAVACSYLPAGDLLYGICKAHS